MLVRNTVVSSGVFLIGLGVLWLLVERAGMDEVPASGIGFVVANSLHYILGRAWIFRGTTRGVASGFALFLVNGLIGLGITMALMAVLLALTPINYLVARVLVSVFAGLTIFVLNAVWNFRRV
nr:GtrA family protein [Altererythrobacter lutimaris]